jgi:hypothetical protein
MASRPLMKGSMTKEQPDWMKRSAAISDDHQILCFALALWNGEGRSLRNGSSGGRTAKVITAGVKEYYSIWTARQRPLT